MNDLPLVSVVITTFNRAHVVARCIDSVLTQNYPNLEVIVVDDCSTDETEEYFATNYLGKIKYVRHENNLGVQYASNTGFCFASGKYVAFIGDDDRWNDPEKLNKQVEVFEQDKQHSLGIVTTDVNVVTSDRVFKKNIKKPRNLVRHLLQRNGIIYGSAALLRADVFVESGKFAEELPKGTDSDVFRRIILLGYDVVFLKDALVDYHLDGGDNMTSQNPLAISRSIRSQFYKLNRYHDIYDLYPGARGSVLSDIGWQYYLRYLQNGCRISIVLSRRFLLKGIVLNPFNLTSWFKLFKSMKVF